MKALITGASSGIGRDIALTLSEQGYDVILVARNKKALEKLRKEIKTKVEVHVMDLSSSYNCIKLYNKIKSEDIDVVINNAGFGVWGKFEDTNIDKELDMIDVNIKAVHILTKLFYKDFKEKDKGYILNVASSAAFLPGPLMATYYATKSYVLRLTEALYEELRVDKSNVYVGCLCPGPVDTNFNTVAGVRFSAKPLTSKEVAIYAVKKMFQRKLVIIPGTTMKLTFWVEHLLPTKLLMRIAYKFQKKKTE
ncbi:MAG: SDR family oxidoreductase [Bacilli bacterium]|nr:SDR family oxidoreductase [Bacilli bacterium]